MSDNGADTRLHEASSEEIADWLTITEAEQSSATPRRTIMRLADDGKIRRAKDEHGRYRYHPDDVAEEAHVRPVGRRPAEDRAPGAEVIEESFRGGVSLLKQAHHHLERMMALAETLLGKAGALVDSANTIVKESNATLQKENEQVRGRCAQLEQGYWDAITARESALSEVHVRELEITIEKEREQRKSRMTKVFEDRAPDLMTKILGTDATDLAKAGMAVEFLKSFDPAMVEVMLESDFLNAKQRVLLCKLLGRTPPATPAAPASSTPATPAETPIEAEGTEVSG